ncbi:MAG: HlyC/CorC family transporter [Planctomycetes bacterium]|nr:HlyC/CorC family transporter [Planctomycetota bacterium]
MIWLALALLIVCSGALSACETALFALTRKDLLTFRQEVASLRRRPYVMMLHPRRVLMTVLIANTTVNVSLFSLSFAALHDVQARHPALAAAGGAAVLFSLILFGELVPKAIALANAQRLAPTAAALLTGINTIVGPFQWLLSFMLVNPITRLLAPTSRSSDTVSTDELRLLVEHSAREGHIDSTENEMLQAVVGLTDASVREVMTPRVDIESAKIDDDRETMRRTARTCARRILPVRGRDLDDIRGVLHAREVLLHPEADMRSLLRPADFIPEQANLAQVMRHFREERSHFAIVVDEYGGTAGLVTNEDAVEWIVGELPKSERPRAATSERIDDNTYRLSGDLSVRVWAERFAVGEIDRHIDTVGGLILSKLGRLPRVGDSVRIRNLTLTVEVVRRRRIEEVLLVRDGSFGTQSKDQA